MGCYLEIFFENLSLNWGKFFEVTNFQLIPSQNTIEPRVVFLGVVNKKIKLML